MVALQDGVRSASRITLTLSDSNDHTPTFDSDQYHVQIPENMPSNMTVFTLSAEDLDSGVFSDITYTLKGFGAEKFVVNEHTGEISVAMCEKPHRPNPFAGHFADFDDDEESDVVLCLDYESQPSYSLTYEARDGGGKHSSVNLFLEILDVNDNAPEFVNTVVVRELFEKETSISPPLTLKGKRVRNRPCAVVKLRCEKCKLM